MVQKPLKVCLLNFALISMGTAAIHNNSVDNCALLFNKYYTCQNVSLFVILTPFGCLVVHQEAHMEVINPFIRDNQQRMVMFLDELSVRLKNVSVCIV